jgi:hypothetical protein
LSENIERALASLKCPHALQAQQLYYLDCIHIFPVIQWLVKKMIEVRQQTDDRLRAFSEAQFRKCAYALPNEALWESRYRDSSTKYLHDTTQRYLTAQRKYKLNLHLRQQWHQRRRMRRLTQSTLQSSEQPLPRREEEDEEVHAVLIQYGQGHLYAPLLPAPSSSSTSRASSSSLSSSSTTSHSTSTSHISQSQQQQTSTLSEEDAKALQARAEQLMRDMSIQSEERWRDITLSEESLSDLQTQGAAYLRARDQDNESGEVSDKLLGEAQHQRHLAQISKQIHTQQTCAFSHK